MWLYMTAFMTLVFCRRREVVPLIAWSLWSHIFVVSEISTLLYWSEKHSYHETTVWHSLTGSFWSPPQCTRPLPHCSKLLKISYMCTRMAFNCVHSRSFWYRGVQVLTHITDMWLYDDIYILAIMFLYTHSYVL